jgi:hypothetical protein
MRTFAPKLLVVFLFSAALAVPGRAIDVIDPATSKLSIDEENFLHIEVRQPDGSAKAYSGKEGREVLSLDDPG